MERYEKCIPVLKGKIHQLGRKSIHVPRKGTIVSQSAARMEHFPILEHFYTQIISDDTVNAVSVYAQLFLCNLQFVDNSIRTWQV